MALVDISLNTYSYQDSGHWQVKPWEKRPMLCLVLLSNFQTSAHSGNYNQRKKKNYDYMTLHCTSTFLLKIGEQQVKFT